MAGHVALAQALSYARDLKALHQASRARERELGQANARLRAAHRQTLRYAEDLKRTHGRVERVFLHSLQALAHALEARDPYTRGHSERVAALGRSLALSAGLPAGPLTAAEWEIMREHPLTGARILAPLEFFVEGTSIVRHHHERQDGSGYPDGLSGAGIPLGARIVAVADVYDALTSDRPYRPGLAHEAALGRLRRESSRTLDADLVTLFVDLVGDAPPARPV